MRERKVKVQVLTFSSSTTGPLGQRSLNVDLKVVVQSNLQEHRGKVVNWHLCTNHKPT